MVRRGHRGRGLEKYELRMGREGRVVCSPPQHEEPQAPMATAGRRSPSHCAPNVDEDSIGGCSVDDSFQACVGPLNGIDGVQKHCMHVESLTRAGDIATSFPHRQQTPVRWTKSLTIAANGMFSKVWDMYPLRRILMKTTVLSCNV